METTYSFRVDNELKAWFIEAARAHDRTGEQLLREFMKGYVQRWQEKEAEHDARFRAEGEQGPREIQDPRAARLMHDAVMDKIRASMPPLAQIMMQLKAGMGRTANDEN